MVNFHIPGQLPTHMPSAAYACATHVLFKWHIAWLKLTLFTLPARVVCTVCAFVCVCVRMSVRVCVCKERLCAFVCV